MCLATCHAWAEGRPASEPGEAVSPGCFPLFPWVPNEGEHYSMYFTGQMCFFLLELFSPMLFAHFPIALFIYFTNLENLIMMLVRLSSISIMHMIPFDLTLKK